MGREPTRASGNAYFEARKTASKWNEKLSSREGAAEILQVSADVVTSAETDKYKEMPRYIVERMADVYNAPHLLKHYCKCNCAIGRNLPVSDEIAGIDRITVELFSKIRHEELKVLKDKILDVAADGIITPDEIKTVLEIDKYLRELSEIFSKFGTMAESESNRSEM